MKDRCWARINLSHIANNVKAIKEKAKVDNLMLVVKANAYGHGAIEVSRRVKDEACALCVATCNEGIELAESDIGKDILVLQPILDVDSIKRALYHKLILTVENCESIERIGTIATAMGEVAKINIAVDSNMHRLGAEIGESATKVVESATQTKGVKIYGIFSHLNTTERGQKLDTCMQKQRLRQWTQRLIRRGIDTGILHLSATDDTLNDCNSWGNAVRIGLGAYGYGERNGRELKPAMCLYARVISLHNVDAGCAVGYDGAWIASKDSKLATLAIGYADGYPLTLSGKGRVYINGTYAPVVGRICMDTCMVDVSNVSDVAVGDEAQMWGDKVDLAQLASYGDTSVYELLSGLGRRIEKIYVE
ncbi:MAG: alanine racemase [Christensenellales bacterium]